MRLGANTAFLIMMLRIFERMLHATRLPVAAVVALWLAGCSVKTTVVGTATTPAAVSHFYVTASAVWLNTSATARATDGTWLKVTLTTPVTIDLYDPAHSTLPTIVSESNIPAGTYQQLLLVLVPNSQALASSASALSLSYNDVVEYPGSTGTLVVPLEFATQTPSLAVAADVVLKGSVSTAASTQSTASSSTDTSTATSTITIAVDALRHLNFLTQSYGDGTKQTFAIYSGPLAATEASDAGGITGTVDVSAISTASLASTQGLVATAETLSADGSRYVSAGSAVVQISGTTGTFTIYPLPVLSSGSTTYDVVIHGPGVTPVLVTGVPVSAGAVSAATSVQTAAIVLQAAPTYAVAMPAVTTSATGLLSFPSGITSTVPLPAGDDIDFYATLSSASSVPHLIEFAALNPLTRQFSATDASDLSSVTPSVQLANANVLVGAYSTSGTITFAAATPVEGTGAYRAVSSGALQTPGAMGSAALLVQPQSTPRALYPVAPASASGITGTLTVTLAPGAYRYDSGSLLVSTGGVVVESIDLAAALAAAGNGSTSFNVAVARLPVGTPQAPYSSAVYDFEVRAWHSGYPSQGVHYSWQTGVDLSAVTNSTLALSLP